jgi:ABC-type spermidine/putrescine transport system permease subunit I
MTKNAENMIEIRVNEIAQLFHTLDPFPFREKDLDREAEEYIVGWARELPPNRPFKIIVHFPEDEAQIRAAAELRAAFSQYFSGRAAVIQGDLNELFRIGRRSLSIGVAILFLCLFSAQFAAGYLSDAPFRRIIEESFLILGWVANWRPLEIFLYDWWPIAHRRDLYRRLSSATIESKPYPMLPTKAAV